MESDEPVEKGFKGPMSGESGVNLTQVYQEVNSYLQRLIECKHIEQVLIRKK